MTHKHTKGPWLPDHAVIRGELGKAICIITNDDGGIVDWPSSSEPDHTDANATLIASAPDLLAALENLIDALGPVDPDNYFDDENGRAIYEKAKDALDKARGGV